MMEMMSWSATISPCAKGSKLFESFDMDFYNEKCAEYDALPQTEKGKYKSRDAYVVIQGGPNLTALNKAYLKLNNEIDSRLKDSSIPERLSIDLLIQQNAVLDLLSSLEKTSGPQWSEYCRCNRVDGLHPSGTKPLRRGHKGGYDCKTAD